MGELMAPAGVTPGMHDWPRDSPIGILLIRIGDELADRAIPPACPHTSSTSWHLWLPARRLLCHDCQQVTPHDPDIGPCAACGSPDGRGWAGAVHLPTMTAVQARVCNTCANTGTLTQSYN